MLQNVLVMITTLACPSELKFLELKTILALYSSSQELGLFQMARCYSFYDVKSMGLAPIIINREYLKIKYLEN
jgi:hypothetical protein